MKGSGPATDPRVIDRYETDDGREEGFGWIAYPDEAMQRASHAIAIDGEVWVIDPVDAEGIDDRLTELGEVAGVVVLLDRHKRDAAAFANRYDVPVYVPELMASIADEFDAPVETFSGELADTGYVAHEVVNNFAWTEIALFSERSRVLVVADAVGATDYFLAGDERLGVTAPLRLKPPKALSGLEPRLILLGHGPGITEDASAALSDALDGARSRAPGLFLKNLRMFLPG